MLGEFQDLYFLDVKRQPLRLLLNRPHHLHNITFDKLLNNTSEVTRLSISRAHNLTIVVTNPEEYMSTLLQKWSADNPSLDNNVLEGFEKRYP